MLKFTGLVYHLNWPENEEYNNGTLFQASVSIRLKSKRTSTIHGYLTIEKITILDELFTYVWIMLLSCCCGQNSLYKYGYLIIILKYGTIRVTSRKRREIRLHVKHSVSIIGNKLFFDSTTTMRDIQQEVQGQSVINVCKYGYTLSSMQINPFIVFFCCMRRIYSLYLVSNGCSTFTFNTIKTTPTIMLLLVIHIRDTLRL